MKKWIYFLLSAALWMSLCTAAAAQSLPVLSDDSGLLNDQEAQALTGELERIAGENQIDLAVVTTDSLDGKSAMDYADDYYDCNGYGEDGVLLLVSMEERDWWVSTSGSCVYAVDAYALADAFLPYLSSGSYYEAFLAFGQGVEEAVFDYSSADDSEDYIAPGYEYCEDHEYSLQTGPNLLICLLIGAAVGLVVVLIMKGQLKTVRSQSGADRYIGGGLNLQVQTDRFLYQNVTRRAKPKENSSSSGGGIHVGSSGRSHGGGGGKF